MAPPESLTKERENQARIKRGRVRPRPRRRRCLLKGCEKRFRPRVARSRYCSVECRRAARKWRRWKAQQKYRATENGKERRQSQSRRYREQVKGRNNGA